jgi:hypothetical protein
MSEDRILPLRLPHPPLHRTDKPPVAEEKIQYEYVMMTSGGTMTLPAYDHEVDVREEMFYLLDEDGEEIFGTPRVNLFYFMRVVRKEDAPTNSSNDE